MYYYFSSNFPAVIKLNGIYYGTIHNAVKSCRIDKEAPFVEICPLNGKDSPTCFLLEEQFLASPPERLSVTDMDGGYMLNFSGGFIEPEFKVIAQQKFSNSVVTVFSENGYKLSIETDSDFYAENILMKVNSAQIIKNDKANLIALFFYGERTLVNVYSLNGGINKAFSRQADSLEFNGDGIITVEKLSDMAKHVVTREWEYSGDSFKLKNSKAECSESFDREGLSEKLIAYAFLEEMLAGGDYSYYLGGGVKENAQKLEGFLGEFIGVMPPPVFRDIDEIGLIYHKKQKLYSVKYFRFEIDKGKIVNITC